MKKYIDFIADIILGTIVKVVGVALLLVVSLQVLSRYLPFHILWTDELARLLFVWFAMLSIALAYIENKHLSIELLYDKFGPRVQNILDYFAMIIVLAVAVLLSYTGIKLLQVVAIQKAPMLRISMAWYYASCPVCFIFISIHAFLNIIERAVTRKHGGADAVESNT